MKLTEEMKTIIVREKLENYATTAEICKKYNLHKETVNQLVARVRIHSYDILLDKNKCQNYTKQEKLNVIYEYQTTNDSMRNIALRHNLSKSTVRNWLIKYEELGENAFNKETRGRKMQGSKPLGKKPKATVESKSKDEEIKQLKKRLAYVEMENEFLKKLDALVRKRVEHENRK